MRQTDRPFATGTKVDEMTTRHQLEMLLFKRGASDVATHSNADAVQIAFAYDGLLYRVILPMVSDPKKAMGIAHEAAKKSRSTRPTDESAALRKERDRRMRALLNVVKARLIAIDEGISTFEEEFLTHIVAYGQETVGQRLIPEIRKAALEGTIPKSLPMPGSQS